MLCHLKYASCFILQAVSLVLAQKTVIHGHANLAFFIFGRFSYFLLENLLPKFSPCNLGKKPLFKYFCVVEDNVDRLDDQYYNGMTTEIMVHPLEICLCRWNGMALWVGG